MTAHKKGGAPRRRRSAFEVIQDWRHWIYGFLEWAIHPVLPFAMNIFDVTVRKMIHLIKRVPGNCGNREDLYRIGAQMIAEAREEIRTVSTIKGEDPGISPSDKFVRDYFIGLHRIAYANRFNPSKATGMTRHVNLKDEPKAHEALSLLYHGAGISIRQSEVPVEFVTADGKKALVGFPARDGLFGGFHSRDARQCRALDGWVAFHGESAYPPTDSFHLLADQIESLRNLSGLPQHDSECLCHVAALLEGQAAPEPQGDRYDQIATWIDELYDSANVKAYYEQLAQVARMQRPSNGRLAMLDIGCGTALGAHELKRHNFEYWGLESSSAMVARAQEHLAVDPRSPKARGSKNATFRVIQCDAIAGLLGVDREAKEFNSAPKKFDVIACQGNSFDSFLGPVQKRLALYLFDRRLHEKGHLVFTGAEFPRDVAHVERKPMVAGLEQPIQYDFQWAGEYCRLTVNGFGHVRPTNVLMHPCNEHWLESFLAQLGYERINWAIQPVTPRGGSPYYVRVFKRKSS